jgi:hypothetical protein
MVAAASRANGKTPVHNFLQMYFGALESFGHSYDPMLKGIARAQLEMSGLMSRRAQAYLEIPARLSQCRGPHDLLNEQMRFWRIAMEEYSGSVGRITSALSSFAVPQMGLEPDQAGAGHDYIKFSEPSEPSRRDRKAA